MEVRLLRHIVNSDEREKYFKVNGALLKAVTILGNRYPEPTMENVTLPNTKRLLEIAEKYKQFEGNWRVKKIVMAVLRILINKIEHSANYRDRFSWFVEELMASGWHGRSYNHPVNDWNEPKPYGGR